MLTMTDGNNVNIPIAIGIFSVESALNYCTFLRAIMSMGNGRMGELLNRPVVVLCSDRHLSFSPAITECLPLVNHRYDVHHIMANMHNEGWKTSDGHMLGCHKAVTRKDFNILMSAWKEAHIQSATYADKIDHKRWTTYAATESNVPYCLFDLTGSQLVEQEMNRMLVMGIRHELPLIAMNNFIEFYSTLLSKQLTICDTMTAGGSTYTQHFGILCRENYDESKHYDAVHRRSAKPWWEVTRRNQNRKHSRVIWESRTCTCHKTKLTGIPCRHLLAVYRAITAKILLSAAHFTETFKSVIPEFYVVKEYKQGYEDQVGRPILTCLELDSTLPPCCPENNVRGETVDQAAAGAWREELPAAAWSGEKTDP
jgi:hypothetical protein